MQYLKTITKTMTVLAGFALAAGTVAHASPITPPGTIEQLIVDANNGHSAEFDVDALGIVSCFGDCSVFNFAATITPHTDLAVATKTGSTLGGFDVSVTGRGGASVVPPALQNLTQGNVLDIHGATSGSFTTIFTDTGYCTTNTPGFPGGTCFGSTFTLGMTNLPDLPTEAAASTMFAAFVSPGTTIPAGMLVNAPAGTTIPGLGSVSLTAANPNGSGGSLTTETFTTFPVKGSVQTTFTISTAVPEPSTFAFFGIAAGLVGFKLRRRKV
jgi:hypothetical protein